MIRIYLIQYIAELKNCDAYLNRKRTMSSTSEPHANEEYALPSTEVLLAGTLALMTGHGQASCGTHREAIAGKIASNLATLSADPMLTPGFKTLMWSLRGRWLNQTPENALVQRSATNRSLWHTSHEGVQ